MNDVVEYFGEENVIEKKNFPFSQMGLFYFGLTIGLNAIVAIAMLALRIPSLAFLDAYTIMIPPLVYLVAYVIMIPLCMLLIRKMSTYNNLPKNKWGIGKLLLFLMICIGVMMAGNLASQLIAGLLRLIFGMQLDNPVNSILESESLLSSVVLVVFIAPIAEEFLFRKVLLDRVRVYGDKIAIILSGVIFGLVHGNLFQVIYATMLGMVLAYVYLKTNQIKYCVGLHMAVNLIGGIIPLLLTMGLDLTAIQNLSPEDTMEIMPQMLLLVAFFLIEVGAMIASGIVIGTSRKQIVLDEPLIEIERGKRFKTICINIGMIVFFISCITIFIIS